MSSYSLLSLSFSLFLLMDPLGNIPLYLSLLKNFPAKRKRYIILRELIIALVTILLFAYAGNELLDLLRISQESIMVSGGIVLFLIAIRMIFVQSEKPCPTQSATQDEEPFVVPLAIPLVAGPSVLAAVMIFAHQTETLFTLIGAILIAWAISTVILLASSYLEKLLGWRGIVACEKLMGLLLTLISTEMILSGLSSYFGKIQ